MNRGHLYLVQQTKRVDTGTLLLRTPEGTWRAMSAGGPSRRFLFEAACRHMREAHPPVDFTLTPRTIDEVKLAPPPRTPGGTARVFLGTPINLLLPDGASHRADLWAQISRTADSRWIDSRTRFTAGNLFERLEAAYEQIGPRGVNALEIWIRHDWTLPQLSVSRAAA